MMIGHKELKIRTNEQILSMMIQRNKKVRPPMKTNYTLAIYGVVQKPRPFQSFVSIIYANMKDKNFLFFWRHYCVVIIVILSDSVCPCCDFSQGWAGGESGGQWLWFVLSRGKIGTMGGRLNPPCCSLITFSHYMALVTMTIW